MTTRDDDISKLTQQWYSKWEEGVSTWWDQVLETPAFLGAMGDNLAAGSTARGTYAQMVDDGLARAHLPTRDDLTRVIRVATLLEDKILSLEDRLLEMQSALGRIEKEALLARVEAAEGRVALAEALAQLESASTTGSSKPARAHKPKAGRTPAARTSRAKSRRKHPSTSDSPTDEG